MSANPETVLHERVVLEIRERVATVTLNRPDKRNALDIGMFDGIVAAAAAIADEPDVRAGLLAGAGPAFCAGLGGQAVMTGPAGTARLHERARLLDGALSIESSPEDGTRVRLFVPLP